MGGRYYTPTVAIYIHTPGSQTVSTDGHDGRQDAVAPVGDVPVVGLADGQVEALTLLAQRAGAGQAAVLRVRHDEPLPALLGQQLTGCRAQDTTHWYRDARVQRYCRVWLMYGYFDHMGKSQ